MRKLLLAAFALFTVYAVSAETRADIFKASTITWLGLDFTQLKLIDPAGTVTSDQLRDKYFNGWNQLFIAEQQKYDVAKALHRSAVFYATEITAKANMHAATNNFCSNDPSQYQLLTAQKIAELVKEYDFNGKSGIGCMFFVEGLNKGKEEGSVWVTFVDMKSQTVLLTERKTGSAGGFGFRNYWAKTFYNVLLGVKYDYKKWGK